jgi:Ca2+-binding RTX toxin-like protein
MFNITIRTSPTIFLESPGLTQELLDLVVSNVELAAEIWGRYIDAPNSNIDLQIDFSDLPSNTLAEAGTSFSRPNASTPFQALTINEFNSPDGNNPDIEAFMTIDLPRLINGDFFFSSNTDVINNPGAFGQIDFLTLALHELSHSLGFLNASNFQTSFGQFVVNGQFTGPNAVAANGGNPIPLIDGTHFTMDDLVSAFISNNEREFVTPLHIAILKDIGAPVVDPSESADVLFGFNEYNDTINGLGGNDTINGLTGDDTLFGGSGNDTLNGGDGDDVIMGGIGADRINGGDNTGAGDTLSYANATSTIAVNLSSRAGSQGEAAGDIIDGIENVTGSAHRDLIFGDTGDNVLRGFGGNDTLAGNSGDDTIEGGDGRDFLFGNDGEDILRGGSSLDSLEGGAGADILDGGSTGDDRDIASYFYSAEGVNVDLLTGSTIGGDAQGDTLIDIEWLGGSRQDDILSGDNDRNYLFGRQGSDVLTGRADSDWLDGAVGDDIIEGGTQNDGMLGGQGNDIFVFNPGDAYDVIGDFSVSDDMLDFSSYGFATKQDVLDLIIDNGNDTRFALGGADFVNLLNVDHDQITEDNIII